MLHKDKNGGTRTSVKRRLDQPEDKDSIKTMGGGAILKTEGQRDIIWVSGRRTRTQATVQEQGEIAWREITSLHKKV